jgi:hypothetical protein
MKKYPDFSNPILRIAASLSMAAIGWKLTDILLPAITYKGIRVGDIGVTVIGIQRWLSGENAYSLYHSDHQILYQYPFTGLLLTSPLLLIPLVWLVHVFCSISTGILAYALLNKGEMWRYLLFLSIPFFSSIHSAQWTPLLAASLIIPALLPLALLKPHTALPLLAVGKWKKWIVIVSAGILLLSFILYPTWPLDWLKQSNVLEYDGFIPILTWPGILLLFLLPLWRQRNARLLLALSFMPQRLWYDQLLLFMVPESPPGMLVLVIGSWLVFILNNLLGWASLFGPQDPRAQTLTVVVLYLPTAFIVLKQSGVINKWYRHFVPG